MLQTRPTQSGFPPWGRLFSLPTGPLGKKMKTSAMNKKSTFRVHTAKNSSLGSLIDYVHSSDRLTKISAWGHLKDYLALLFTDEET